MARSMVLVPHLWKTLEGRKISSGHRLGSVAQTLASVIRPALCPTMLDCPKSAETQEVFLYQTFYSQIYLQQWGQCYILSVGWKRLWSLSCHDHPTLLLYFNFYFAILGSLSFIFGVFSKDNSLGQTRLNFCFRIALVHQSQLATFPYDR